MASQIVLILGAGANIGKSLVQKFSSQGFKVAIAARTPKPELVDLADASVKADFTEPSSIKAIFAKVKSEIGIPNVVIYNAGAYSTSSPNHTLSVPVSTFEKDLAINVTSVYAAAQAAVAGFDELPSESLKTFIFTGNGLNTKAMPVLLTLGVGKTAAAHLIWAASLSYKPKGYSFYYADERKPNGDFAYGDISGEAAGEYYYHLSQAKEQGPWLSTFVKGSGYVDFQ